VSEKEELGDRERERERERERKRERREKEGECRSSISSVANLRPRLLFRSDHAGGSHSINVTAGPRDYDTGLH